MSWEAESELDTASPVGPGSPLMLLGLAIGLLAMSPAAVLYYWLFAPIAPLVVGGVLVLTAAKYNRLFPVAEGCFAATLFGVVFVAVGSVARGNIMH